MRIKISDTVNITFRVKRLEFLRSIFPSQSRGFICLGSLFRHQTSSTYKGWQETFFKYPDQLEDLNQTVETWLRMENLEIYFCPHLLYTHQRKKELAMPGHVVWADLDECPISKLEKFGEPMPNLSVKSSKDRFQVYWLVDHDIPPAAYENLNQRIAHGYKEDGCDQCWALTHMMRVPFTYNWKRGVPWFITHTLMYGTDNKPFKFEVSSLERYLPQIQALDLLDNPEIEYGDMKGCLGDMTERQSRLWSMVIAQGERSEAVFRMIAFLKRHGFGDGRVIEELMEHPVLKDKWPDEGRRREDIERCILKLKT